MMDILILSLKIIKYLRWGKKPVLREIRVLKVKLKNIVLTYLYIFRRYHVAVISWSVFI